MQNLGLSKFKAFAGDNKLHYGSKMGFVLESLKTIVENRRNSSYEYFLLFHEILKNPVPQGLLQHRI